MITDQTEVTINGKRGCVHGVSETDESGVNERTDYAYLIVKT